MKVDVIYWWIKQKIYICIYVWVQNCHILLAHIALNQENGVPPLKKTFLYLKTGVKIVDPYGELSFKTWSYSNL